MIISSRKVIKMLREMEKEGLISAQAQLFITDRLINNTEELTPDEEELEELPLSHKTRA